MAENPALIDRILLLPYELRRHIYSFVYCIDYDALQDRRDYLRYTDAHRIPPRAILLMEPLYIKYREQCHDFKSDDESWARLRWPDDVEEAFLTVSWNSPSHAIMIPVIRVRSLEIDTNKLISETVSALTGIERDRKECSSHLQLLRDCSPIVQNGTAALPLIEDIIRTRFIKGNGLADALFSTFQGFTFMRFNRGLSILERLQHCLSPALLAAITRFWFKIDKRNWEFVPWHRLGRDILPCLDSMNIDLDFNIDILLEGHENSVWTRLEEHMQETVTKRGAKQIVLWLKLKNEEGIRNRPETIQRFETMLAPKMPWRDAKHHPRGAAFILNQCQLPVCPQQVHHSYLRGPGKSNCL